jgi:heparin binding hemagglutinin HbhA
MAEKNTPTIDDLKTPLLAAVGAADLALATVNEIVLTLRERAGEARSDASTRVEETRERLSKLQEDLPKRREELRGRREELRGRINSDELRKTAEGYLESAQTTYQNLVERGEAALERLRSQPGFEENVARAEQAFNDTVELTETALGNVATQTRAVGERAAKLIGVDLPKKADQASAQAKSDKASAKKAPAKKAPAKKAPAKKVTQK